MRGFEKLVIVVIGALALLFGGIALLVSLSLSTAVIVNQAKPAQPRVVACSMTPIEVEGQGTVMVTLCAIGTDPNEVARLMLEMSK